MSDERLIKDCRLYRLPRGGHAPEEYEDAGAGDRARGRFAVADGASESTFAGRWAQLLVEGFTSSPLPQPQPLVEWIAPLQVQWLSEAETTELSWYAEAKVREGAFATFLGLMVERTGVLFWRRTVWWARAVGDSCLFHVRAGELLRSFPVINAAEFGNSPWLVGSRPEALQSIRQQESSAEGDAAVGDVFWLMTDALAQWFLRQVECGGRPWESLEPLLANPEDDGSFSTWIAGLRDRQEIRNDDVTLLAVCL
jgi:hypothetical protein